MSIIYKYKLNTRSHGHRTVLQIPMGSEFLYIGVQLDAAYAWFELNDTDQQHQNTANHESKTFHSIETGYTFMNTNLKFRQTVIMEKGRYVAHIYEEIPFINNKEFGDLEIP